MRASPDDITARAYVHAVYVVDIALAVPTAYTVCTFVVPTVHDMPLTVGYDTVHTDDGIVVGVHPLCTN